MTESEFLEQWESIRTGQRIRHIGTTSEKERMWSHLGRDASETIVEQSPYDRPRRARLIQLDKPTLIYRAVTTGSDSVGAGVIRGLMKMNKGILVSIIIGNSF